MASLLVGASQDCYKCALTIILRMWSTTEFAKVQAMSKASQLQILKALTALNCDKECIEVPSGLTAQEVSAWLSTVLNGRFASCTTSCIIPTILRLWTPPMLSSVKLKPLLEQQKIVQGIISFNCQGICFSGPISIDQVSWWVQNILPSASPNCQSCIVSSAMKNWTTDSFNELLGKPLTDQVKTARLLADFNCPDVCGSLPPAQECDTLPY
jgi:hypothetical protein